MISKQSLAFGALLLLCVAGLIHTWVLDDRQQWPVWVWLPLLALGLWAMWQLRDPPDPNSKAFDFNPRRGLLYFCAGFLIFPTLTIIEALFGADLSLNSMLLFTVFGSILVGVVGTFTEHVGV